VLVKNLLFVFSIYISVVSVCLQLNIIFIIATISGNGKILVKFWEGIAVGLSYSLHSNCESSDLFQNPQAINCLNTSQAIVSFNACVM
jgi:hypothetical protein